MAEVIKVECLSCREQIDETHIELRIEGIGSLCSECAEDYRTAHWAD